RGQEVQAPRGQEVQAPRGQEVQAPRGQEIQAPRTLAPRSFAGARGVVSGSALEKAKSLVKQAEAFCMAGKRARATAKAKAALAILK
ncbi:MAG: hypothetical protein ACE5JN_12920, partial [Candidatus Methylomirabilia bacterium]